ncbi:class I SAM-dependent methyltransferase [Spirosoma endophyticum]|uniref:Ubiquinone/menaquinone biosynthesis C-methylase UbiE n=1 Tax=Spirosoma endophyticum TaxID=662367 RepID=A0A1I1G1W1_9BACT|nr:class I SAM-dependent methyltransferase [Spirosoma endophyticum]SFC05306.1 Ubiquinone/menaquinone biosynthesis C-methylase UbiE [Spirosoma endophyticum]
MSDEPIGPKPNTGSGFDWIAPVYDALAFVVFGRKLQQAQLTFLNRIPHDATILLVGGGTGWLLEQVLIKCKPRRVLYLELSARMVAKASHRMVKNGVVGSVEFRVGDVRDLPTDEPFDILITPFLLDLFPESTLQTDVIPRLLRILKPTSLWLVTDFVATHVWWQKALLWSMIRFFQLTAGIEAKQLPDWQRFLADAGLIRQESQPQVGGMVRAEIWGR